MRTRLLVCLLLIGACTAEATSPTTGPSTSTTVASRTIYGTYPDQQTTTSTTTTIPTTTTQAPTTSTTEPFVDLADPIRLVSQALDTDAEVTTESCATNALDPCSGTTLWVPIGDRQAGACELGLVLMLGHVNANQPFYHLVDDSANDYANDHGLLLGDSIDLLLSDGTGCRYETINPFGSDLAGVSLIDGQPAIYFPKDPVVMNPILNQLITQIGDQPILMMVVSYGGLSGDEFIPDTGHRLYNAVVFARLTEEG